MEMVENEDRSDLFAEDMRFVVPRVQYFEALFSRKAIELPDKIAQNDLT